MTRQTTLILMIIQNFAKTITNLIIRSEIITRTKNCLAQVKIIGLAGQKKSAALQFVPQWHSSQKGGPGYLSFIDQSKKKAWFTWSCLIFNNIVCVSFYPSSDSLFTQRLPKCSCFFFSFWCFIGLFDSIFEQCNLHLQKNWECNDYHTDCTNNLGYLLKFGNCYLEQVTGHPFIHKWILL